MRESVNRKSGSIVYQNGMELLALSIILTYYYFLHVEKVSCLLISGLPFTFLSDRIRTHFLGLP